jgi:hypothetical protein
MFTLFFLALSRRIYTLTNRLLFLLLSLSLAYRLRLVLSIEQKLYDYLEYDGFEETATEIPGVCYRTK